MGRLQNVTIDVAEQSNKNPGLAIKDLNTYTNSSVNNCNYSLEDHFVYSSLDCPSDTSSKVFANSTWTAT